MFFTSSAVAIETSSNLIFFLIFLSEAFLSPATKNKVNLLSVLKSKLFTIAPTSHPKEDAASKAVLADVSKTLTLKFWSNSLIILPTLRTGSLSSNVIIQL